MHRFEAALARDGPVSPRIADRLEKRAASFRTSAPKPVTERTAPLRTVRDPSDTEDISMVEAFLAGDPDAFEFLFDKYREKVYRVAFRFVRSKEDALEITQDVFLRVYQNMSKFKTNSKFFTWLYRITANRSIDFTRSRRSQHAIEVDQQFLEAQEEHLPGRSSAPDPSLVAQGKELEDKLAEAVDGLSDKHRIVFVLHARENLSYKQIAEVVECNIGTVMSRLFYARKKLQEQLRLLGIEPPFISERAG